MISAVLGSSNSLYDFHVNKDQNYQCQLAAAQKAGKIISNKEAFLKHTEEDLRVKTYIQHRMFNEYKLAVSDRGCFVYFDSDNKCVYFKNNNHIFSVIRKDAMAYCEQENLKFCNKGFRTYIESLLNNMVEIIKNGIPPEASDSLHIVSIQDEDRA